MSTLRFSFTGSTTLYRLIAVIAVILVAAFVSSPVQAKEPKVGSVRFDPALPQTGDNLKVTMKFHSGAIRAQVRWLLNDNEVQVSEIDRFSSSAELNHPIRFGDKIKVEATPFDDLGDKGRLTSRTVVCQNAPPHLRLVRQDLEDEAYVAEVAAEDPEGGAVTFTLREGPEGMTVDGQGRIRWDMPKDATGNFRVKIAAKDEEGGEAVLSYNFTVRR